MEAKRRCSSPDPRGNPSLEAAMMDRQPAAQEQQAPFNGLQLPTLDIVEQSMPHDAKRAMEFLDNVIDLDEDATAEPLANTVQDIQESEERGIRGALSGLSAQLAATHRGVTLPFGVAEIKYMPEGSFSGGMFIAVKVQLSELMVGDLKQLLKGTSSLSDEAKQHIAQRSLLQMLHMQDTAVCHDNFKPDNLLMRPDGSFLLGDLGASSFTGAEVETLVRTIPAYAEPDLILFSSQSLQTGNLVTPDINGDLWSLGVITYEIFTGKLRYELAQASSDLSTMKGKIRNLLSNVNAPKELMAETQAPKIPARWQELLSRLLEPRRKQRISALDAVEQFSDLIPQ
ncbi:ribosomal protein S6 kinase alpha-5 [Cyclospora cayetanensis]|uniref:Ribosomal protein S6 kinase alpha-5 n=1 Tax=Cyclospora cayetanensis TaxID=88456 RepID=A0A6P6RXV8_9EIME|nr:ribosomal protein S6 kinase alpha-5 [Cyclospora cayetanensis]